MNVRPARFSWFELRTSSVSEASTFYENVFDWKVVRTGESTFVNAGDVTFGEISTLPAAAAARGAPAHWLGHIAVDEVEGKVAALLALGACRLGPSRRTPDGGEVAIVRDPFGSVFAMTNRRSPTDGSPPRANGRRVVPHHLLNTLDAARASEVLAATFDWMVGPSTPLGDTPFEQRMFSWRERRGDGGDDIVGSIVDTVRNPAIHPHWLFHFRVDDLDRALEAATRGGGRISAPPNRLAGARAAQCEDPQGAAFGLSE